MTNEFELLMTGQQFKKIYEKKYEDIMNVYGLRKIELDILYFLANCGSEDTAKDIAKVRYISKAHVSSAVENLTARHFIEAREDGRDRRCVHLSITSQGQPIVDEIAKIQRQVSNLMYQGITEEERRVMQQVAAKIAGNLEREIERNR